MDKGREHVGVYKMGLDRQKMEQMIGGAVSIQAG